MEMPMSGSVIIENGTVYVNGKLAIKNILVENGKIAKVTNAKIQADETIDAAGLLVLPGSIDPHVHFREPGLTYKEDFRTGSFAAAAGGVTCVLDMPNTKPPTLTNNLLLEKTKLASKKSVVNFGFHFGSSPENLAEIKKAKRIASVKIFMDASTGNMLIEDENAIRDIISNSRLSAIHAEGRNVKKAIGIAQSLGKKFYLCHISTESEMGYARQNRKENLFVEATPHHLFLTENDQNRLVRMKPSLKNESDRRSLWDALNDGTVDVIASDHAPHTIEEKQAGDLYGVPGVETRLPLMLDAVSKRRLTLKRMVETMCENPAKIFRLKNKGFIKEGNDADLVIVDMKLAKKVRNDGLFTKCGWSPFEGFEIRGWPTHTLVNGNVVFENGEIQDGNKGEVVEYG